MQRSFFFYLLIILALLLYSGKSGAQNLLTEVKPVLESIGGDEIREALKSAEEISNVLSAVSELTGAGNGGGLGGLSSFFGGTDNGNTANFADSETSSAFTQNSAKTEDGAIAFPLKPISSIADRDITYSLSQYIMQN